MPTGLKSTSSPPEAMSKPANRSISTRCSKRPGGGRTWLVHTFRQFPFLDPELPEDLVPEPQHRPEAIRLFHDLYAALAPPAQRHFDLVTVP